jgi:hypothetical protein
LDVEPEKLSGVDHAPQAIRICREANKWSRILRSDLSLFSVFASPRGDALGVAALEQSAVLPDPPTHYRVHAGSLFLGAGASEEGERGKALVIAELADALRVSLPATGAPQAAVDAMLEIVDAEAAQLRLKLDGGWPWETFQTERTIYRVQHADASAKSKIFRTLSMALPPRWFYGGRQWLGAQNWYKRVRSAAVPVPGFTKLEVPGAERPGPVP